MTPLADVVSASHAVAETRARTTKIAVLAELFARLAPHEVEPVVGFLVGVPRQGRVGVGWATVWRPSIAPALEPSLTVGELDELVSAVENATGAGSQAARATLLERFFTRATADEQDFVRRLFVGELRQGALAGIVGDAVAKAAGVNVAVMRRAAMLQGDRGRAAALALHGGAGALEAVQLHVLHPVQPMLAASAPDIADAMARTGEASVEWKLDGARVQVHRRGDDVRVYTRNLNDITDRVPSVVDAIRALPEETVILDGEIIGIHEDDDRPRRFQDTMSDFGAQERAVRSLAPFFFDALHIGGTDLLDAPLTERRAALDALPGVPRVPAIVTASPDEAAAFLDDAVARGHEGVMVKALDAPYEAGRRGSGWRKVKPVHTLDLVVLAAEWGHGRRRGWLSNLHLGARGHDGEFVMVGKTFKGLTDELLQWQTERFQELAIGEEGITVHVRPEQVVEIALDGVQVSTRYPGGVALRFARVRRYRNDKSASEADTIEAVQALLR
ncbi:MAG TPA: ATP-dependent DNA ligase [Acidimicrobiia bacterium]